MMVFAASIHPLPEPEELKKLKQQMTDDVQIITKKSHSKLHSVLKNCLCNLKNHFDQSKCENV